MATMKLNVEGFKQEVFDYTKDREWNFKGERPMVIDFYADWCGPCKMLAPVMDELSDEYAGKVDVRKVDTERENELAQIFGIRSIPSLLFIPKSGKPQMVNGALPKKVLKEIIDRELMDES